MQKKSDENRKISTIIRKWLLVVMLSAFLVLFIGLSVVQALYQRFYYYSLLTGQVEDVIKNGNDGFTQFLSEWTGLFKERLEQKMDSLNYAWVLEQVEGNKNYISELNIVDANGIIIYSSNPDYLGFDMRAGEQSSAFLCLLDGTDYYSQEKIESISYDESIRMAYAGRAFSNGKGFFQIGVSKENYDTILNEYHVNEVNFRHVGLDGSFLICDKRRTVIASLQNQYDGQVLDSTILLPQKEGEYRRFQTKMFGRSCYVVSTKSDDCYIIGFLPIEEAARFGQIDKLMIIIMIVVILLCVFKILSMLLSDRVIKSIERINTSVEKITGGDLEEKLAVNNSVEFEKLSVGINSMVDRLKTMIAQEKARIEAELTHAKNIQKAALPSVFPPFPNRTEFDIYATMDAAREVGGDFYDFFMMDDDHLAMVVADVSGKGIPAALFMMVCKTLIRSRAAAGRSPADILIRTNAALAENDNEDMFVTVWLGILTISTGELTFASAGHERLAVCQDGSWHLMDTKHNGVALGLFSPEELDEFSGEDGIVDDTIVLKPGDAVFQYTDGVTEANGREKKLFGEKRLLEALADSPGAGPESLLPFVRGRIDEFVSGAPQFDDITMLGLIYKGKSDSHASSDGN
ncbi:MAG: SpoIIE family protein phosphatase [Lachnospiraceae bacterium]|nr:SpoIIE family protein phosphatase [Lachnospiraceae bacterium]